MESYQDSFAHSTWPAPVKGKKETNFKIKYGRTKGERSRPLGLQMRESQCSSKTEKWKELQTGSGADHAPLQRLAPMTVNGRTEGTMRAGRTEGSGTEEPKEWNKKNRSTIERWSPDSVKKMTNFQAG